jgi:hypothetical protein
MPANIRIGDQATSSFGTCYKYAYFYLVQRQSKIQLAFIFAVTGILFALFVMFRLADILSDYYDLDALTFKNGTDYLLVEKVAGIHTRFAAVGTIWLVLNLVIAIVLLVQKEKKRGFIVLFSTLAVILLLAVRFMVALLIGTGFVM